MNTLATYEEMSGETRRYYVDRGQRGFDVMYTRSGESADLPHVLSLRHPTKVAAIADLAAHLMRLEERNPVVIHDPTLQAAFDAAKAAFDAETQRRVDEQYAAQAAAAKERAEQEEAKQSCLAWAKSHHGKRITFRDGPATQYGQFCVRYDKSTRRWAVSHVASELRATSCDTRDEAVFVAATLDRLGTLNDNGKGPKEVLRTGANVVRAIRRQDWKTAKSLISDEVFEPGHVRPAL